MRIWIIRGVVLSTLAVVLWYFGPQAWIVLAARVGGTTTTAYVDLDLVGPDRAPQWLRKNPALFRAVLEELSPHIDGKVRIDDEVALTRLAGILDGLSWVEDVRLRPASGGGFKLSMVLRRPVLEVVPDGSAIGAVAPVYVTAAGICLKHGVYDLASGLPTCRLLSGPIPGSRPVYILGREHPDPRVLAAALVAAEWRDEMRPLVPDAPRLVEVDASNLHYRMLADRRISQVRVVLERAGGGTTRLDYGLPPNPSLPRVAITQKAQVLRNLLGQHPGLAGVEQADLRFVNTWANWVRRTGGTGGRARGGSGR